jgi:hypothetical protein
MQALRGGAAACVAGGVRSAAAWAAARRGCEGVCAATAVGQVLVMLRKRCCQSFSPSRRRKPSLFLSLPCSPSVCQGELLDPVCGSHQRIHECAHGDHRHDFHVRLACLSAAALLARVQKFPPPFVLLGQPACGLSVSLSWGRWRAVPARPRRSCSQKLDATPLQRLATFMSCQSPPPRSSPSLAHPFAARECARSRRGPGPRHSPAHTPHRSVHSMPEA